MIKKILVLSMLFFITIFSLMPSPAEAIGGRVVGSSALKLFESFGVKTGLKGADDVVQQKATRHVVRKLSKDGKIVSTDDWIKAAKTAPTVATKDRKFLKYTMRTSAVVGILSLVASASQETTGVSGDIELTFMDQYKNSVSDDMIIGSPKWHVGFDPGFNTVTTLYYQTQEGIETTQLNGFNGEQNGFYWNHLGDSYNFNYNYNDYNGEHSSFISVHESNFASSEGLELESGSPTLYQSIIPKSDLTYTPDSSSVPDPDSDNTIVYVPTTDEGMAVMRDNPDMLFNPDPYVNDVPEPDSPPVSDGSGEDVQEPDASNILDFALGFLTDILNAFKSMIQTLLDLLRQILEQIKDFLEWLQSIFDTLNLIYNWLLEQLMNFLNSLLSLLENIWGFLQSFFGNLGDLFNSLFSFLESLLNGLLDSLIGSLNDLFGNIASLIDSLISSVSDILNWLNSLLESLFAGVESLFINLFVPSPDFLITELTALKTNLDGKFPDVGKIPQFFGAFGGSCVSLENKQITVFGVTATVLDWSYLKDVSAWTKPIMASVIWLFVCAYAFRKVSAVLNGRGGV